ncbi:MAG: hypothetical protein ACOYXR_00860 [Nitrospirota bacterium]
MRYEANYDTAVTYLMAGLTDRAKESFLAALAGVEASQKVRTNVVYLRILAVLAKIALQQGARAEADAYIVEGLRVKPDHADLLFLRTLYCWEEKRFDDMFGAAVSYLVSYGSTDRARYEYEFFGDGPVREMFATLIPLAYAKSATRLQTLEVVRKLAETTKNPLVQRAYQVMTAINTPRTSNAQERAAS